MTRDVDLTVSRLLKTPPSAVTMKTLSSPRRPPGSSLGCVDGVVQRSWAGWPNNCHDASA